MHKHSENKTQKKNLSEYEYRKLPSGSVNLSEGLLQRGGSLMSCDSE